MEIFIVYVLRSEKDKKRYIVMTKNLERRLTEYNTGKGLSTKNRSPLVVIYTETFEKKSKASKRELFFKIGKGREFLSNIGA